MHSDGIWNHLELQRSFWHKEPFACIIVRHSETIFETAMRRNSWCLDLIKGVWSRPRACNHVFFKNKVGDWCIRMLFEPIIWKSENIFENKGGKWCILSLFDTMFWPAEKILIAVKLNGAFWRFLRPMLDDSPGSASGNVL